MKQNPFSLYDFLGYFTPGAIFIYSALLIHAHSTNQQMTRAVTELLSFDRAEIYIPFILFAYTLGHLLSFVSSITVERYSIWAHGYPSKYLLGVVHPGYFSTDSHPLLRGILRACVGAILLPVSALDWVLGKLLKMRDLYTKSLDGLLISLIDKQVVRVVKHQTRVDSSDDGSAVDHDFFRFVYHYAVEHAPNHLPKMQNYVALFGFLRTITLLAVIFFWFTLWHAFTTPSPIHYLLLAISAISAFLFYMAFVKFYRRFSLEALMAVTANFQAKGWP